jgi:hypothetical protein
MAMGALPAPHLFPLCAGRSRAVRNKMGHARVHGSNASAAQVLEVRKEGRGRAHAPQLVRDGHRLAGVAGENSDVAGVSITRGMSH